MNDYTLSDRLWDIALTALAFTLFGGFFLIFGIPLLIILIIERRKKSIVHSLAKKSNSLAGAGAPSVEKAKLE